MAGARARIALLLVALVPVTACAAARGPSAKASCRPPPDAARPQYVVGYGSLMQEASRERTAPHAAAAYPVTITGYRRGWYVQSKSSGPGTTYLGVVSQAGSFLNAVLYEVGPPDLAATDERESRYCRVLVERSAIARLTVVEERAAHGQTWIYETSSGEARLPDKEHPLAQSYVDVFLAGCLEQEMRFVLPGFAARCVRTTYGWSAHWVNDRLYPRRPFVFQPFAAKIDQLLADEVPLYWSQIRLEGEAGR
jgi:hypothetical protein